MTVAESVANFPSCRDTVVACVVAVEGDVVVDSDWAEAPVCSCVCKDYPVGRLPVVILLVVLRLVCLW